MNDFWARFGKRACDLFLSFSILVFLFPVLVIVALLIRIKLGSPILFTQQRLGKDAEEFKFYKFRSMSNLVDKDGNLLSDEIRLSRFGKFLRSTSFDELPQIINIIKGEMSFIGPRATLPSYKNLLLTNYPKRFKAIPGITSLPAIRGRNALSWDEKFAMDVEYVENFSFKMDMYIFFRTIPVILKRDGISMQGSVTATRYDRTANKNDNNL